MGALMRNREISGRWNMLARRLVLKLGLTHN